MRNKDKPAILVVNDERPVLRIIQAILESAGFAVVSSESVAGAMKVLSMHGAPDLIITDIHMPEIDGWSFCRLLRMDEYLEFNEVPVLMISATFITDEIRRISLENGASDHLAVPFSAAELIEKVSGLIAGKPVKASFDILIVEQDDERRNSLERAFTERGFHARTVKSLRFDEFTDKNAPSVIVYNPGPDGTGSLQKIRRFRASRPDTVILVTVVRNFMVPPSSFLYAGAAAVRREDADPRELVDAVVSAGRQSAFLRAGAILKEKITQLREGEERYRFLVENITGAIVRLDTERRICYASPVIEQLTGLSPGEVVGQRIRSFVPEEDLPAINEAYERAMAGEHRTFEFKIIDKNGGVHHVRASARPIYTDGAFSGSTVLLGDITEERRAKEALAHESHMLAMLMDTVPDHIYFKDLESRFIKVNRAKAMRHGLDDPEEMTGESDAGLFSDEHAGKARADEERILETRRPLLEIEEQETWPDGSRTWVATSKFPLCDHEGKLMGTFGISRDITARKEAEQAVFIERRKLADIIDAMPNPVFYQDAWGRYEECNQAFVEYLGLPRDKILGYTAYEVAPSELTATCQQKDLELIASKGGQVYESIVRHADGSLRDVMFYKTAMMHEDGRLRGLIGMMLDITELNMARNRIQALLDEKEILLQEVHHRIKNNMNTIASLLSLHSRSLSEERAVAALDDAQGRIRGMMLIYDRLYRSKDFRQVSAAGYLGDLIKSIAATSSSSSRITIEDRIADRPLDSKILFPLGIIINELLSNACKYAFPDGQKGAVAVSLLELEDGTMEMVFQDDGVGLPETAGFEKSSGFGLMLVGLMVKQIGGTIMIEREGGSRFVLKFRA